MRIVKDSTKKVILVWIPKLFLAFQPPLVQAVFYGDADEVRALLYKKEDVNSTVSISMNSWNLKPNVKPELWFIIWDFTMP